MWISELTTNTSTADNRIGSHSASSPIMVTSLLSSPLRVGQGLYRRGERLHSWLIGGRPGITAQLRGQLHQRVVAGVSPKPPRGAQRRARGGPFVGGETPCAGEAGHGGAGPPRGRRAG